MTTNAPPPPPVTTRQATTAPRPQRVGTGSLHAAATYLAPSSARRSRRKVARKHAPSATAVAAAAASAGALTKEGADFDHQPRRPLGQSSSVASRGGAGAGAGGVARTSSLLSLFEAQSVEHFAGVTRSVVGTEPQHDFLEGSVGGTNLSPGGWPGPGNEEDVRDMVGEEKIRATHYDYPWSEEKRAQSRGQASGGHRFPGSESFPEAEKHAAFGGNPQYLTPPATEPRRTEHGGGGYFSEDGQTRGGRLGPSKEEAQTDPQTRERRGRLAGGGIDAGVARDHHRDHDVGTTTITSGAILSSSHSYHPEFGQPSPRKKRRSPERRDVFFSPTESAPVTAAALAATSGTPAATAAATERVAIAKPNLAGTYSRFSLWSSSSDDDASVTVLAPDVDCFGERGANGIEKSGGRRETSGSRVETGGSRLETGGSRLETDINRLETSGKIAGVSAAGFENGELYSRGAAASAALARDCDRRTETPVTSPTPARARETFFDPATSSADKVGATSCVLQLFVAIICTPYRTRFRTARTGFGGKGAWKKYVCFVSHHLQGLLKP